MSGQRKSFHELRNENTASVAIAALMELQAEYTYPHRMESDRLVMFYDDRVTDPQRDLEAMDQHVAKLEAMSDDEALQLLEQEHI